MTEVQLQSLIIEAVRRTGGAAHKMSSKFLIGVSDLLVKLPGDRDEPMLLEVKLAKFSTKIKDDHIFKLDVTVPQQKFLNSFRKAGMRVGVISGIQRGTRLALAVLPVDGSPLPGYTARVGGHTALGQGDARLFGICAVLRDYLAYGGGT